MKEYQGKKPVLVIGGTAQDFLGEYIAGGILMLLGLNLREGEYHKAEFIGTGMHGGFSYIRGNVEEYQPGKEGGVAELEENDYRILHQCVSECAARFSYDAEASLLRCRGDTGAQVHETVSSVASTLRKALCLLNRIARIVKCVPELAIEMIV